MDTHVAEPAQTVDAPAVPIDQPNVDSGEPRTVSGSLPQEDEWTWISDAAEVEIPTPPTEHKPSPFRRPDQGPRVGQRPLLALSLVSRVHPLDVSGTSADCSQGSDPAVSGVS